MTDTSQPLGGASTRRQEALGILCLAATLLLALSLFSYDSAGGENWIGPVGAALAGVLASAFGAGAWVLPVELGLATLRLFRGRRTLLGVATAAATLILVLTGCALLHLTFDERHVFGSHLAGGVLGEVLGEVLRSFFGFAGALVLCSTVVLLTLVLRTSMSVIGMSHRVARLVRRAAVGAQSSWQTVLDAWREARAIEQAERESRAQAEAPRIATGDSPLEAGLEPDDASHASSASSESGAMEAFSPETALHMAGEESSFGEDAIGSADAAPSTERRSASKARRAAGRGGPRIVTQTQRPSADTAKAIVATPPPARGRDFVLPPSTLFESPPPRKQELDEETLRENATRLTEKLEAYGVHGRVDEIHPGPVVTMYEVEPRSGTKVSKIAGLADDLAMALAAQKVRIVAPIPGKARVGFELPNEHRETVMVRDLLEDNRWRRLKAALPIALGKDIAGQPVYGDLAKMPHLLVAGATGSGKSVGLNLMLVSLLAKKTPEEVRMLMIDPKVVELAVFDGIPHMLLPVVTDMKKAALALRWAVDEMERRYQLFADAGARNITTYNERVEKVLRGDLAPEKFAPRRAGKVRAQGPDGQEVLLPPSDGEAPDALDKPPEKLPYVVVVVDEFADLMMVAAKDVEACVARLAQKARAAGIHVILATQRPSVDVITGMIKANFPARIAFKVSQREDSKTILGRNGAEHLLGMGDMLMIPPGASDLQRVHCAYVSEDEVKECCDFLRAQGDPVYDDEILKPREDDGADVAGPESDDPVYDRAVAVVAQAGYCSISHIQRQLSVGYNKAAKLVERMEQEGVVGPASGKAGGRREVLVQPL